MNLALPSLPHRTAASAGAAAEAPLRGVLSRLGSALWKALEAAGVARAQPHLLDFADRCEAQHPELARELRTAARHGPMA